MATTYDKASLVMIPSGYKDDKLYSIKPTDGSGDFTFSRDGAGASPATRVNATGLIEKGRTNELLQSNSFDTSWTNVGSTETGGQSGYDGSNDAWLIEKTAAAGRIAQLITTSGLQTASIYAKAGTLDWIAFICASSSGDAYLYFDLANGVKGTAGANTIDSTITSVGGGWYRLSITFDRTLSAYRIYPADGDGVASGTSGNIYIQDAQLESGLVATSVIETTTAAVSAGLLGDMPRLDYSGGATCPSLLLEPSRTNLVTQSEYFGAWTLAGGTQSITDNYAISPEGVQNAARAQFDKTGVTYSRMSLSVSGTTSGVDVTFSVYLKANSGSPVVHLQAGPNVGTAIELTNEWQRYEITGAASGGTTSAIIGVNDSVSGTTETADILVYGAQLESSASYPTSYIPTYGSASTRGADDMDTTFSTPIAVDDGFSLFMQFKGNDVTDVGGSSSTAVLRFQDSSGGYLGLVCTEKWRLRFTAGGASNIRTSPYNTTDDVKLLVKSDSSGWKMYANGAEFSNGSDSYTWGDIEFCIHSPLSERNKQYAEQIVLFPTALTDAECIALTTI
jgi:hypothetical protein